MVRAYCIKSRLALHHQLYDALSRIHLGPLADPGGLELCGVAPLPFRRHRHDGVHAIADDRIHAAGIQQSRHVDARRRHRAVQARIARSRSTFRARSSSASGGSRSRRISKRFSRSICPGTKVVIGQGPQEAELQRRFPDAKFLGLLEDTTLAAHLAAADVFVFPSRTDTFGVVQLEALACGVPIAAFPVTGPRDVVGGQSHRRHRTKICGPPAWGRCTCRARLVATSRLSHSWENSARQFIGHIRPGGHRRCPQASRCR